MKCKVFTSSPANLEENVNTWLDSVDIDIIRTEQTQNQCISLIIFYKTRKEVRRDNLDKLERLNNEM